MGDSILNTIKQMLGIYPEDTAFDTELITHINNAIADLIHMGDSTDWNFRIYDSSNRWSEFVDSEAAIGQATQYVYCKVRLIFDPPSNSFVVDSIAKSKEEAGWRFYEMLDQERINKTNEEVT